MLSCTLKSAVIGAVLFVASSVHAAIHQFEATLSGLNEVPPNGSPGTGSATITFDDSTNVVSLVGSYTGLLANVTASHIHLGPAGVNGGVIITLANTGGTSGTLSGAGVLSASQVTALFNEGLYVNVHTSQFPGGEIRGQIILIPAPAALALLGIAGMIGRGRRRA